MVIDIRPYTSADALFAASPHISIYQRLRADGKGCCVGDEGGMININSRAD